MCNQCAVSHCDSKPNGKGLPEQSTKRSRHRYETAPTNYSYAKSSHRFRNIDHAICPSQDFVTHHEHDHANILDYCSKKNHREHAKWWTTGKLPRACNISSGSGMKANHHDITEVWDARKSIFFTPPHIANEIQFNIFHVFSHGVH